MRNTNILFILMLIIWTADKTTSCFNIERNVTMEDLTSYIFKQECSVAAKRLFRVYDKAIQPKLILGLSPRND